MRRGDREILQRLERARADLHRLEERQRAVIALPDVPLPAIDQADVDRLVRSYVDSNPTHPDPCALDSELVGRAKLAVAEWEQAASLARDQKLGELEQIRAHMRGLEAELAAIRAPIQQARDTANDTVTKADMRRTKAQYAVDPLEKLPTTPPPAGGMLPGATSWKGRLVFWLLLSTAALVDVVAFVQVIALVLPQLALWMVWAASVGFTAIALWLMHLAGQRMAHRKIIDRKHPGSSWTANNAIAAWAVLGGVAFRVRSTTVVAEAVVDSTIVVDGTPITLPFTLSANPLLAASLFLGFYVGSGVVALVGAYTTYDPDGPAKRQALEERDRLVVFSDVDRLHEMSRQLGAALDRQISGIEQRLGASSDDRIAIVAGPAVAAAQAALRSRYNLRPLANP